MSIEVYIAPDLMGLLCTIGNDLMNCSFVLAFPVYYPGVSADFVISIQIELKVLLSPASESSHYALFK
jgi:hypothetical protein